MSVEQEGSVTRHLGGLKAGDPDAASRLWERYFADLVRLARGHLRGAPRGAADEEDVALDAFEGLCRGVGQGHFPRLDDRDDLWRVLIMLTARRAATMVQRERRQKRGGGRVVPEADLAADSLAVGGLAQAPASGPTPELAALMAEACRELLGSLPDESHRRVAELRLEGYTDREVADRLGCGLSTVERRMREIRAAWVHAG